MGVVGGADIPIRSGVARHLALGLRQRTTRRSDCASLWQLVILPTCHVLYEQEPGGANWDYGPNGGPLKLEGESTNIVLNPNRRTYGSM